MTTSFVRPFLKWPGGKFRILKHIIKRLPPKQELVEPFAGSGAVFLNTEYDSYKIGDINPDLIGLYKTVQKFGPDFIDYAESFFTPSTNKKHKYYEFREQFNATDEVIEKSALFLYLNRHGYNGLCRYNKKAGAYNVPFGSYKAPYFPKAELENFYQKSERASFHCCSFVELLQGLDKSHVVYADPPYVPLSTSAYFTQYHKSGFTDEQQKQLATLAKDLAKKGVSFVLSNHSTSYTKKLYDRATNIYEFGVPRNISCKKRKKVKELLAVY